jgi:hypothetical protein
MSFYVVFAAAAAALSLSWVYFRRFRMSRPPFGVVNLWDIAFVGAAIITVPFLYLALPVWLVAALSCLAATSVLYFTWEPAVPHRSALALALLLAGTDVALAAAGGGSGAASGPFRTMSRSFLLVNNLVLVLLIVGVANLWAQGGLKARDAAILSGGLAVYDLLATGLLPITGNLLGRLAGLPFQPMVAWPLGDGSAWLGIGMGDLLLSSLFPLAMRKAFTRDAGIAALVISLAVIGLQLALPGPRTLSHAFPAMVVLGPLMVTQYLFWQRRCGRERKTWQYLRDEPAPALRR